MMDEKVRKQMEIWKNAGMLVDLQKKESDDGDDIHELYQRQIQKEEKEVQDKYVVDDAFKYGYRQNDDFYIEDFVATGVKIDDEKCLIKDMSSTSSIVQELKITKMISLVK